MQPQCNEGGSSLDPLTSREDEPEFFVPVEPASETISKADCLIITGTTLINDTLEELLRLKKADARVVVLGPTAGMLPEAFFRRDVDVLGGHHGNECRPTLRFGRNRRRAVCPAPGAHAMLNGQHADGSAVEVVH